MEIVTSKTTPTGGVGAFSLAYMPDKEVSMVKSLLGQGKSVAQSEDQERPHLRIGACHSSEASENSE